jgi:DNA invertase Pin-like site-specific DNA recombinase
MGYASGTTTQGREELRTVLDFLRKGDVLMVTRIDRLARSILHRAALCAGCSGARDRLAATA